MLQKFLSSKLFLFFFLVGIVTCTFFQDVVTLFVDLELKRLSQNYLEAPIEYDELHLNGNRLRLKNLNYHSTLLSFKGDLEIKVTAQWLNRRVLLDSVFKKAQVKIEEEAIEPLSLQRPSSQMFSLLPIYPKISIDNASFTLSKKGTEDFSFILQAKQRVRNRWDFDCRLSFDQHSSCLFELYDYHPYLNTQFTFQSVPAKGLQRLLNLVGFSNHELKVNSGSIDGELNLDFFAADELRLNKVNIGLEALSLTTKQLSLYLSKISTEMRPMLQTSLESVFPHHRKNTWQQFLDGLRRFDFLDNRSSCRFLAKDLMAMDISQLTGRAYRNLGQDLHFDFKAQAYNQEKNMGLQVIGRSFFNDQFFRNIKGNIYLIDGQDLNTIAYSLKENSQNQRDFSLYFSDFSSDLFSFIFPSSFRSFDSWYLSKGVFSGDLTLCFQKDFLKKIYTDNFLAKAFSLHSKAQSLSFEQVKGKGSWDFTKSAGSELSLDLELNRGDFSSLSFDMGYFQVKELMGQLVLNGGFLQKAFLHFQLDNIQSSFFWDDHLAHAPVSFSLEGKVKDIVRRLSPDKFLKGEYAQDFLEQGFSIKAEGAKGEDKMLMGGSFSLDSPTHLKKTLPFQGDFPLDSEGSLMKDSFLRLGYYEGGISELVKNFFLGKESIGAYRFDFLKFWGEGVDIKPFVSSYLFDTEDNFMIEGLGNIQGQLKPNGLLVEYEVEEAKISSSHFIITAPKLGMGNETNEGFLAKHYIDFVSGIHHGYIPIEKALYQDQHFDLYFQDIYASMYLMEDKIVFENLHTHFSGSQFSGSLELDYGDKPILMINAKECSGSLEGAKNFYHQFSSKGKDLNLQGYFNLHSHSYLKVDFSSEEPHLDMLLEGTLDKGTFNNTDREGFLKEVKGEFSYDHLAGHLDLSLENGQLSFSSSDIYENGLSLDKSNLFLRNLPEWSLHFDLYFQKGTGHMKGQAYPLEQADGKVYRFSFDSQETYFGHFYPHVEDLVMRDFKELMAFKARPSFSFSSLAKDIDLLSALSLLPLNTRLGSWGLYMGGIGRGEVSFDKLSQLFHYQFSSKDMEIEKIKVDRLFLSGKGKGQHLYVEELYLDDFFLSTDIQQVGKLWRLNFLNVLCQNALKLQIHDAYQKSSQAFCGKVSNFELDFDFLKRRFALESTHLPSGYAKLKGEWSYDSLPEGKWESSWDLLEASLSYKNLKVHSPAHFEADYTQAGAWSIKNTSFSIGDIYENEPSIFVDLSRLKVSKDYSFSIDKSFVKLKKAALPHVRGLFKGAESFPIESFIERDTGHIALGVEGAFYSQNYQANLYPVSGTYSLLPHTPLPLEEMKISLSPLQWEFKGSAVANQAPLLFSIKNEEGNFDRGELHCFSPNIKNSEGVLLNWERKGSLWDILKVKGRLPGLNIDFSKDEVLTDHKELVLQGSAKLNFKALRPYLPFWLQQGVDTLALGRGYNLEGEAFFPREGYDTEKGPVFKGSLKGKDFELFHAKLDKLFSKVELKKDKMQIFETFAKDPLGNIYIDTITLAKQEPDRWELSLPLIRVEDFYPKLFKQWEKKKKNQSMMISLGELRGLKGVLGEPKSFQGSGVFEFKNVSKTFVLTPLLFIPGEIIARIGLDPTVLSPFMGTVLLEFGDGVIYVKELRDVYSKGKRSRFYLAGGKPSFIEFDGSLNVSLKIEYYSLILKPLDLITLTMKGYIHKPIYTIQKRQHKELVRVE